MCGRTSELNTKNALELSKDLGIGNSPTGFVVLKNRRLLIDLLSDVLLG